MIVKYLYILFLGILLALFVGVGITAFYPGPVSPTSIYTQPVPAGPKGELTPQQSQEMARQEALQQKKYTEYDEENKIYNRNVSIITLVFAVLFVLISFSPFTSTIIFSDGFLLGGLFTLFYSIARGFQSNDDKFRFFVVTVSLLIVLFLGYKKFFTTPLPQRKRK